MRMSNGAIKGWLLFQATTQTCHPERNEMKSRDLRIIVSAEQFFGAKILRLAALAQDDSIFG